MEFFEVRKIKKYVYKIYSIRLRSDNKIYIHIHNNIIINQIEDLIDVDKLIEWFTNIGFKLETRGRLDKDKFKFILYIQVFSNDKKKTYLIYFYNLIAN